MRVAVIECHASFTKVIQMGKGMPNFNLTGLAQQSDTPSLDTFNQWKRRNKVVSTKDGSESMDMTQLQHQESGKDDVLFFMGMGDMEVRDNETEEDLALLGRQAMLSLQYGGTLEGPMSPTMTDP